MCVGRRRKDRGGRNDLWEPLLQLPGDGLRNTSGGATFDLTRLGAADHDRFVNSVLNGRSQMPPWRGVLDMEQIESIWSFYSGDRGSLKMH
jgi:hypothetical protein